MKKKYLFSVLAVLIVVGAIFYHFHEKAESPPAPSEQQADSEGSDSGHKGTSQHQVHDAQAQKDHSPASHSSPSPRSKAEAFHSLIQETLKAIPTVEDLRKLSDEEVHLTPDLILKAGIKLGEIAESLEGHPELNSAGSEFYLKCAKNKTSPTSIRALCYSNLLHLDPEHQHTYERDSEISAGVRHIAESL